ncbi:serine/threonine-protein kinase [Streptomyces sp. NPDC048639]|uniref:serine/threonine-protein kinase n=1 Tax=Streptomyces sp. NPDC048639 TaxID=3365581 RepID=UPI0037152842
MTNMGGRADEPSSYGLQPPAGPTGPVGPAGRDGNKPVPSQGHEPTQVAHQLPQHQPPQHQPPYQQPPQTGRPPAQVVAESAGHDAAGSRTVPAAAPDVGRLVGGRYRLDARLGHGGMGTVWRAHDVVVDRDVAVKEPRVPDHLPERERRTVHQRMQREARAAARIDHPSVVTVHDVVVEDGRPWIVMELVRGQSLADRLQEGTLDPREAARIGAAVLGALAAAHEAGVLHRDVKPANVLLGRHDRVVLTDFGIAQVEGEQGLTETGAFVGSPEFTAPERVLGQRPGPESDLWSLGVVLYAAVEGMSPYRRSTTPATLQAVLSAEPQMPSRGAGALGTLIMQLLRKDPAARPTAYEIRQTLESVARPPESAAAARLAAPGSGAGGSAFVPPVLHGNRKAQLGFGAALPALAAVLVLIFANPFATEGMPAHWVVREEGEVVGASLAVPGEYRRTVNADDQYVEFADPSGVFTIEASVYTEDIGTVAEEAEGWVDFYDSGGESGTEVADARSERSKATQQGRPAEQVDTTYKPYNYDEDDISYRKLNHIYVDKAKKRSVVVTVSAPARGEGRKNGEELFRNVVKYLDIQDL